MKLPDRMAQVMADEGRPLTAEEIGKALHVRRATIEQALATDARFARTLPGRRSPRSKLYVVLDLPEGRDGRGLVVGVA